MSWQQEALRDDVPIIRQDMQSFLKVLLAMHQPKQILEVGTAVGFSALLMADQIRKMCHITTIEKYEKRDSGWQRRIFKNPVCGHRITLLEGDALAIMQELTGIIRYDISWMQQRGSIFIFCRMRCGFCAQAVF